MKCIKCHQDLREGAKFCTICGAKQIIQAEPETNSCYVGNQPMGESISKTDNAQGNSDIRQTRNYLFWHIQPGEIARIINESEFLNYDSARGIIINQGTTARIYAHGTLIATLQGGKYDFISSQELDAALDSHFGGLIKGVKRFIARLIYGRSVRERIESDDNAELKRATQINQVIQYLNNNNLFSVVLLQDREFELVFGDSADSQRAYSDFCPINVQTAYLNIQMGVSAAFKISDHERFVRYYLTERQFVATELLAKTVALHIENAIRKYMENVNLELTDIARVNNAVQSCLPQIESELRQIDLNGISLQRILKLTCDNEDIERFRQLSHELYVSEEELNYLNKTNEFKNRLATTINQQRLQEARTEADLDRCLREINKDRKISDEELERFYIVLSRERRIFEAQSAETEQKAMDEIHKTRFLRDEELMILKHEAELRRAERETQLEKARLSNGAELQSLSYRNGFALKLMQLKDSIDYERVRTSGEGEINMINVANELGIASRKDAYKDHRFEVELNQTKMKDDYDWTKRQREQEAQNDQVKFALNIAAQSRQMQLDSLKAMNEMESAAKDRDTKRRIEEDNARRSHEKEMHAQEVNAKLEEKRIIAGMTKEQIEATQLSSLSESAQVAYVSAGKEKELERALSAQHQLEQEREFRKEQQLREDRLRQEEAARQDNFIRMLVDSTNRSMDTIAIMSGNMVENRNEQRREYRDELHREQERHDIHQDRALNYTTRTQSLSQPTNNKPQSVVAQQPLDTPQSVSSGLSLSAKDTISDAKICLQCNKQFASIEKFCDVCGRELEFIK